MLYGVSLTIQRNEINKHCRPCRKFIMGGINLGDNGYFIPCRQDDCPHEAEAILVEGIEVNNEPFTARKLKEVKPCQE